MASQAREDTMKIKDRIAKLIDVKSIITIALVIVLCIITLNGQPTPELFNSAIMLVIGFYLAGADLPLAITSNESTTRGIQSRLDQMPSTSQSRQDGLTKKHYFKRQSTT